MSEPTQGERSVERKRKREREGSAAPLEARPRGLAVIIFYKFTKAIVELGSALVLAALTLFGLSSHIHDFATYMREAFAGRWSVLVARALLSAAGHLWLVTGALAFDGALSSVEGFALYRGYKFAPWLVVVTTSSLLPFEIRSLVREPRPLRFAAFVINVGIVLYLGKRAAIASRSARETREARETRRASAHEQPEDERP